MDHNIDPNHIPHCDDVAYWALLEGKSEAAATDLEQQVRCVSQTTSERIQAVLGMLLVLSACCLSAWSALRHTAQDSRDSTADGSTLVHQDFRFQP